MHFIHVLQYYSDMEGKQVADAMALQVLRDEMTAEKKTVQEARAEAHRRQQALQEQESALLKERSAFDMAVRRKSFTRCC